MSPDADCDVVIVGSGPGGATVADVCATAGWSVIVLEKGRNHLLSLDPLLTSSTHLELGAATSQ